MIGRPCRKMQYIFGSYVANKESDLTTILMSEHSMAEQHINQVPHQVGVCFGSYRLAQ